MEKYCQHSNVICLHFDFEWLTLQINPSEYYHSISEILLRHLDNNENQLCPYLIPFQCIKCKGYYSHEFEFNRLTPSFFPGSWSPTMNWLKATWQVPSLSGSFTYTGKVKYTLREMRKLRLIYSWQACVNFTGSDAISKDLRTVYCSEPYKVQNQLGYGKGCYRTSVKKLYILTVHNLLCKSVHRLFEGVFLVTISWCSRHSITAVWSALPGIQKHKIREALSSAQQLHIFQLEQMNNVNRAPLMFLCFCPRGYL